MNQSLDNDEVLNVRWATEDPNPKAKVYEYERLVEMGHKGIGSKLTDEFVAAVRRMDELEGLAQPLPVEYGENDVRTLPAGSKRLEIEAGSGQEEDGQPNGKRQRTEAAGGNADAAPAPPKSQSKPPSQPPQAKGLLSGAALDSLKKAAALKRAKMQKASLAKAAVPTPAGTA